MTAIGRYRVIRPLGHGGMAEVYLAHDPSLERDVALKLLHRDPQRAGLRDEAKVLAALRDPGIVTIFEIGEHEGRDFIAMEYLPGGTLRDVMPHLTRARLVEICGRVATAVAHAHGANILHRDIKPENVIVGDRGEVKVVDFGIARRLARPEGRVRAASVQELADSFVAATIPFGATPVADGATATALGTPAYMAPEVLQGEPSSAASDVYSLGVALYECLAKQRPFDGPSLLAIIGEVIDGKPPARLDDELGTLVERMLARDPAKRPRLAEVVAALAPALPAPRRPRWPFAVVAVAIAAAGGVYVKTRPLAKTTIEVRPIDVAQPSVSAKENVDAHATASAFAIVLASAGGERLAVGSTGDADAVVTAHVHETGANLEGELTVTARDGHAVLQQHFAAPELAQVLDAMALATAQAFVAGASLPVDRERAQALYFAGKPLLDSGRFGEVRPYLELAVDADPSYFDAWYGLIQVREWLDVSEETMRDTFAHALASADSSDKRDLIRGTSLFLDGDVPHARAILDRLERDTPADSPLRPDVEYFWAETAWHDGRHDEAFAAFARLVNRAPRLYSAAAVHAFQYAVVRRDGVRAGFYVGVLKENDAWAQLASGNYEAVATGSPYPFSLWALTVLDRPLPPEVSARLAGDGLDVAVHRLSRAIGRGDDAAADAERELIWSKYVMPPVSYGDFESLAELELCAGHADQAKRIVTFLGGQPARSVRGYHRISILAAAALGDRTLLPHGGLTTRNTRLAQAAEAELDGDRATAATVLAELVADPTAAWDYPERCALIRDLTALGRSTAAVCADTLRPPMYRPAFLAVKRLCGS